MKHPLHIHVIWHPDFKDGSDYAKLIYSTFNRNTDQLFGRSTGIPVYFRSSIPATPRSNSLFGIDFTTAAQHCVVFLADIKMAISDDTWTNEITQLVKKAKADSGIRIIPMAFTKDVMMGMGYLFDKINWARIYEGTAAGDMKQYLLLILAHELCKQLYVNDPEFSEEPGNATKSPIKLFISHAKVDGLKIAEQIKKYIEQFTIIDLFFDARSISQGEDFAEILKEGIYNPELQKQKSTLLVIQTDLYSTREWCRFEVLTAKKYNCPAIVVNAIQNGEGRGFPYMANVPTIRWSDGSEQSNAPVILRILTATMRETLRIKFKEQFLDYSLSELGMSNREHISLANTPELLDLINHQKKFCAPETLVIYPDPPLGENEIMLLREFNSCLEIRTPLQLVADQYKDHAHPLRIGISISESPDLASFGLSPFHLNDAMIEIARYLLAANYQLAYGGDLTRTVKEGEFNFVSLLKEIVVNYRTDYKANAVVENYSAYPRHKDIADEQKLSMQNIISLRMMKRPSGITIKEEEYKKLVSPSTPEEKFEAAACLTSMRVEMNHNIKARIILGGRLFGYQGILPGLVEEVLLALKSEAPVAVYVLGGFGGCAKAITDAIQTGNATALTKETQFANSEGYEEFYNYYNEHADAENKIDYSNIVKYLHDGGTAALRNGLTEEENKILFSDTDVLEMVGLILKGLGTLQQ